MEEINIEFSGKVSKQKQETMKIYLKAREKELILKPLVRDYHIANAECKYKVKITGSNVIIDAVAKWNNGNQKIGFETTYQDVLSYLVNKLYKRLINLS